MKKNKKKVVITVRGQYRRSAAPAFVKASAARQSQQNRQLVQSILSSYNSVADNPPQEKKLTKSEKLGQALVTELEKDNPSRKRIARLIKQGAPLDAKSDRGSTPVLMLALDKGLRGVAQMMIKRGAPVDLGDVHGDTPMIEAARRGYISIVRKLVEKKIPVDMPDRFGNTPLMLAALGGHLQVVQLLHAHQAQLNLMNDSGETPLLMAVKEGHRKVTQFLLAQKVDVNHVDFEQNSALMLAFNIKEMGIFNDLLSAKANIAVKNDFGRTLLSVLAEEGEADLVKMIVDAKAGDIDEPDNDGATPLMYAAEAGHVEIFKMLVAAGADFFRKDSNRKSVFAYAQASMGYDADEDDPRHAIMDMIEEEEKKLHKLLKSKVEAEFKRKSISLTKGVPASTQLIVKKVSRPKANDNQNNTAGPKNAPPPSAT